MSVIIRSEKIYAVFAFIKLVWQIKYITYKNFFQEKRIFKTPDFEKSGVLVRRLFNLSFK